MIIITVRIKLDSLHLIACISNVKWNLSILSIVLIKMPKGDAKGSKQERNWRKRRETGKEFDDAIIND